MKKHIPLILLTLVLTACGGGGGGGGSPGVPSANPYLTREVPFYTPTRVGSVSITATPSDKATVSDIFTADLTGSGSENVIIAGRLSQAGQPNANNWVDSQVSIFGWENGQMVNQTGRWFTAGENVIKGTEPSVKFGDFLGNGKTGMYVAPSTDTTVYSEAAVFVNNGTSFNRVNLNLGNIWSHDSAVHDFNSDGKADIFNTDFNASPALSLSNGNGTFTTYRGGGPASAAVAVGDFMDNGTNTLLLTDTYVDGRKDDAGIYSWSIVNGSLQLNEVARLPIGRFDLPKWAAFNDPALTKMTHSIRALGFDFDNSGKTSAVIISSLWTSGAPKSEVQFLKNNGNGNFTDVTDTVLVGYNNNTMASYNPKLIDVNGDGLMDIFLSGANGVAADSTRVLIHTSEHKYVDSYINVFNAFKDQTGALEAARTSWTKTDGQAINIVKGPNNEMFLVTTVEYSENNSLKKAVYLSKMGVQTPTAQASISAIRQAWPYMSTAQANEVLSKTSTTWLGFNVIDLTAALTPVGDLRIPLNNRLTALNGYVNGLNLNGSANALKVLDGLGRDFTVNYSSTSLAGNNLWFRSVEGITDDTRGAQLGGIVSAQYNGMKYGSSPDGRSLLVGLTGMSIAKNTTLSMQYSTLPFNPFVQLNGSWGTVKQTATLETTLTSRKDNWVSKLGLMYTKTNIESGLVTQVNDITSLWTETGYEWEHFKLFGGMLPKVINGSADISMPTGVDNTGKVSYTNTKASIYSPTVRYARASYSNKFGKNVLYRLNAITTTQKQHSVFAELKILF